MDTDSLADLVCALDDVDAAVGDALIPRNPAHGANRPRVEAARIMPFTADEIGLLHTAAPDWFDVALTLGLGAGLRQSERPA